MSELPPVRLHPGRPRARGRGLFTSALPGGPLWLQGSRILPLSSADTLLGAGHAALGLVLLPLLVSLPSVCNAPHV